MTEIFLPAMGEGITDATITRILKKKGESVSEDEAIFEIATDKVDSEIPAPADGIIHEISVAEGDVVTVGSLIALLAVGEESAKATPETLIIDKVELSDVENTENKDRTEQISNKSVEFQTPGGKFLSPLVRSIARKEGIAPAAFDQITGSGLNGRITKEDVLAYLKNPQKQNDEISEHKPVEKPGTVKAETAFSHAALAQKYNPLSGGNYNLQEMDRMRKLIGTHMLDSKRISPHVTSFVEVDMTPVVNWRNAHKEMVQKRDGQKLTFMPVFVQAVVEALKDFPGVNVSVDGDNIVYKKDLNIGMAAAMPSGNLIVPVIKNADKKSLLGLTETINDLAGRARNNKLKPDEIKGGTFTITNMGTFGNITGTPIINQPEVAILAVGAIKKKPAVIETTHGDLIGIRHIMIMSMAYDHRVVDGAMGGMFLKRVADILENWKTDTKI